MPWNQLIGTHEEVLTKEWLTQKGFSLINQNWSCCHGEVDIIATFFGQLHFIVVTTKACAESGLPLQGVTRKRMLSFQEAAEKYLARHPRWKQVIFDVLTISIAQEQTAFILTEDIRTT